METPFGMGLCFPLDFRNPIPYYRKKYVQMEIPSGVHPTTRNSSPHRGREPVLNPFNEPESLPAPCSRLGEQFRVENPWGGLSLKSGFTGFQISPAFVRRDQSPEEALYEICFGRFHLPKREERVL
jgi:hypothetical protein